MNKHIQDRLRKYYLKSPDYDFPKVSDAVRKLAKVESKFYINLEKMDSDGNVLDARKIGTPDLKRKGVSNYRIDRIFTDSCGKSLIFIVEKTVIDDTGKSIRYMVEAARF